MREAEVGEWKSSSSWATANTNTFWKTFTFPTKLVFNFLLAINLSIHPSIHFILTHLVLYVLGLFCLRRGKAFAWATRLSEADTTGTLLLFSTCSFRSSMSSFATFLSHRHRERKSVSRSVALLVQARLWRELITASMMHVAPWIFSMAVVVV